TGQGLDEIRAAVAACHGRLSAPAFGVLPWSCGAGFHDCSVTGPPRPHGGHGQYARPSAGRNRPLTPIARPANVPVRPRMPVVRTHVRNSAGPCPRIAGFEEHTGFWQDRGLAALGTAAQWR